MKVKLIGKIRYSCDSLYKVTHDKPIKYFCEHCREKRGKVLFIETEIENPKPGDGTNWCKMCADTLDVGEDTPAKPFKRGQAVYYEGWGGNKVYCKFIAAISDDYCVIEVSRPDGSSYTIEMEFEDLFSD
jgi:hypothetical protein